MRTHLPYGASLQTAVLGLSLLLTAAWTTGAQAQTVSLDQVSPIALTTSSVVSAVRIDPQTGNVTVRTSNGTYNACSFTPPTVPTINNFAPTSSQVAPSASITLNWTSSNTTHCTAQQGSGTIWSSLGQLPSSGSQNLTAPATAGTITFQLTCTDGAQSDIKTTQVSVQSGGGGTCAPTYPNGTIGEWNAIVNTWPAFGVRPRLTVPFNGFVALRFTTTAVANQFGSVHALTEIPGSGDGFGIMSISRDPGCFNPSSLGPRCLTTPSANPSIGWSNAPAEFSCHVGTGQSWYVNISFGNTTLPSTNSPYCPISNCVVDLINQIQD